MVIFCIGLGSDVDVDEMNLIASDPDKEHVFLLSGFDKLEPNEFVKFLDAATCQG